MKEEFRTIPGLENYSVSCLGNIINNTTKKYLFKYINQCGYYFVYLVKSYRIIQKNIHRLVGEVFIQNPDYKPIVDHINNNRIDNRIENLRWVSYAENAYNRKIAKNNTSGIKGVSFNKLLNKWVSQICVNYKSTNLGYFEKIEEAKEARQHEAKEIFGEYLNECEKVVNININAKKNIKIMVNVNINIDKELEELENEFKEIINK